MAGAAAEERTRSRTREGRWLGGRCTAQLGKARLLVDGLPSQKDCDERSRESGSVLLCS